MQIQDIKIEEYLELVEELLSRLANFRAGDTCYFFLCHAFYKDSVDHFHNGQIRLKSQVFKGISPKASEKMIQDLILHPFGISCTGSGFGSDSEWWCLPWTHRIGAKQACWINTRRCIFLLCLRKEILDQIQQGNEVFDIEQIYKRLKV